MLDNRRGESCNTKVEGHNYVEGVLEQSPLGVYVTSIWPWLSWHLRWQIAKLALIFHPSFAM